MGKGDIKTKRGKISNKSYGVRRKAKDNKKKYVPAVKTEKVKVKEEVIEVTPVEVEAKVAEKKKKEPATKKPAAKKTTKKVKEDSAE